MRRIEFLKLFAWVVCFFGLETAYAQTSPSGGIAPVRIETRLVREKGVFFGKEKLSATLHLMNDTDEKSRCRLSAAFGIDTGSHVVLKRKRVTLPANSMADIIIRKKVKEPGFYRVRAVLEKGQGNVLHHTEFNLGYEPEKMVVHSSAPADFGEFWQTTLKDLAKVNPEISMVPDLKNSTPAVTLYQVRMRSFGNEIVGGFYMVPKKPGKYPVIVRFLGYGSGPGIPTVLDDGFIYYIASTRGQGVMKPENTYGDWMAYRLDSRDDYYYRGAYMDLIRAIDFVCSRPEVDTTRIAVTGGSQGGAFSFLCAALDKRVDLCLPSIPGFCDMPNFIALTKWPGDIYRKFLTDHPEISRDALYHMLSYYDVKNFAPMISCPVYLAAGLQDPICPPRTNFAPYNLLNSEKHFIIYPETKHGVRNSDYNSRTVKWIREKFGMN